MSCNLMQTFQENRNDKIILNGKGRDADPIGDHSRASLVCKEVKVVYRPVSHSPLTCRPRCLFLFS